MIKRLGRWPLVTYFALAFAWTWLCWWSVVAELKGRSGLPVSQESLKTLGQFGPFVAAAFVTGVCDGRDGLRQFFRRFVLWRANPIWMIVALFLLPATMLIAIYWSYALGSVESLRFPDLWSTLPLHFVYLMTLGGPLGEEPGWRGFALPRLQLRYGAILGSVWLGLLHATWHLPLWWMHRPPCPFWMYVIGVVLVSFLFTWLFNHTHGSVLYSLIFHASMSIASVRLPEAPAYWLWIIVLVFVVLGVFVGERTLGKSRGTL